MKLLALLLAAIPALPQTPASTLQCPAAITVTETPSAPGGWRSADGKSHRPFERISIYNGHEGGREFELAPTGQKENGTQITQTWTLKAYRDMNLFLRCRYRDTAAVLSIDIPSSIAVCTFIFDLAPGGRIVGKPTMTCK